MHESLLRYEQARNELAQLLPLRDRVSRASGRLRVAATRSSPARADALLERARRCERVIGRLDARIRLAADVLSGNDLARALPERMRSRLPRSA
jgi:hypothetical protein